ncbi:anthranilate phosphoribosyltransferase [bacterium]|nr:anthranilate phosphoribosyltransferase [bacterium]
MEKQTLMEPKNILEKLLRRENLDAAETARLFECLTSDAPGEIKAALLVALRAKGETVTEIAEMARCMRERAVRLPDSMCRAIDTCGTGGDGSRTLNLSTLSAITISSMGLPVVKHGNRSVSSSCGSADVLEGLGLPLNLTPDQSRALFEETRFAFLFAPHYHPAMKTIVPVRKALQIRTIFNFLGPLSNPARVDTQVLGVPEVQRVKPYAEVLKELGLKAAAVVHGQPCMDEVSPCGPTRVAYFRDGGSIREDEWTLDSLGIKPLKPQELQVSGAEEAVSRARAALSGKGPESDRTAIAVNAAAALYIYGEAQSLKEGVRKAADHLAGGEAARHWEKVVSAAGRLLRGTENV